MGDMFYHKPRILLENVSPYNSFFQNQNKEDDVIE